jgi:competence protein ComEC
MGGSKANLLATIAFISLLVIIAAFSGCTEKVLQSEPSVKINMSCLNNTSAADSGSKELLLVHFLDVGQGDSILIQFAGKNVLIDGGEEDMGLRVVSYLKDHGVSGLDLVVATHPHSDHIGGLITVLNAVPVKQILDNGQTYTSQTYENFLTIIHQKNIPFKIAERGQKINIDPRLKIDVLSPPPTLFKMT